MTKWYKYWFCEPLPCSDGTQNHKWLIGHAEKARVEKGVPVIRVITRQCRMCGLIEELQQKKEANKR